MSVSNVHMSQFLSSRLKWHPEDFKVETGSAPFPNVSILDLKCWSSMDSSIMEAKVLKHFTGRLQAFGFQQENTVVCSYYRAVRLFNDHYFKQWFNIFDKYYKIYLKYSNLLCWFVSIINNMEKYNLLAQYGHGCMDIFKTTGSC